MTITTTGGQDLTALKAVQHQTWSSGDYGSIAWITVPLADELVAAVDPVPGSSVLDVATGTGHVAIATARAFCPTTGIDYVSGLIDTAQRRAAAEGLDIAFGRGAIDAISPRCLEVAEVCRPENPILPLIDRAGLLRFAGQHFFAGLGVDDFESGDVVAGVSEDHGAFGRVRFIAEVIDQHFDVLGERSAGRQAQT